jgi:hypothetical protein
LMAGAVRFRFVIDVSTIAGRRDTAVPLAVAVGAAPGGQR